MHGPHLNDLDAMYLSISGLFINSGWSKAICPDRRLIARLGFRKLVGQIVCPIMAHLYSCTGGGWGVGGGGDLVVDWRISMLINAAAPRRDGFAQAAAPRRDGTETVWVEQGLVLPRRSG